MQKSLKLRLATPADSALISAHRHNMFLDNDLAKVDVLARMDEAFEPWVHERLSDSRYVGFLLEEDNVVVAGAGLLFCDFPPHWRHAEPARAYVLNVYTEPAFRGQGLAKRLMGAVLDECRQRGVTIVTLHASPQGRPMYEGLGFSQTDEMLLTLSAGSFRG